MIPKSPLHTVSDQESDSSPNTEKSENRFDSLLDDLLGNLSLGTNMTIKNRKERSKVDNSDRSKECDAPGPSSSRNLPSRSHPYLRPDLLTDVKNSRYKSSLQSHEYPPQSTSFTHADKEHISIDKISKRHKRINVSKRRQGASFAKSPDINSPLNDVGNNSEDEYYLSAPSSSSKSEENFGRLLKEKKGWQLVEVGTDGACLFRSVAHQIFGDEEKHELIRKQVCDYMLKNREHFSPYVTEDFDHYIARKQHPNCHGNHVEIQAIAELYNRPVEIYRDNIDPVNVFHAEYRNSVPIRLSYHGHVHYNSIIDPFNPTFGLGLGMPNYQPGLPEPQLMQKALVESEDALIEDAMLRDKLLETDQLEIEHCIEDQVMRESYYEYLKTCQKSASKTDKGSSSRGSPKSDQKARSPLPFSSEEIPRPSSPILNLGSSKRKATSLAKSRSVFDQSIANSVRPTASNFSENSPSASRLSDISIDSALLCNIPPEMLDMDEDTLMALVLDQSRQEYIQSLNAKSIEHQQNSVLDSNGTSSETSP